MGAEDADFEALWECRDVVAAISAIVAENGLRSEAASAFFFARHTHARDPETRERAGAFFEIIASLRGEREPQRRDMARVIGGFPPDLFPFVRALVEFVQTLDRNSGRDEIAAVWRLVGAMTTQPGWPAAESRFQAFTLHQGLRFALFLYWTASDLGALDDAIGWGEACIACLGDADDARDALSDLAAAYHARHLAGGARDDLTTALLYWEEALRRCQTTTTRAWMLVNLSAGYYELFRIDADLVALDKAVSCCASASEVADDLAPADRARLFNNYGNVVRELYALLGDREDLAFSVLLNINAVKATPEGSRELGRHLDNLGSAYTAYAGVLDDEERRLGALTTGVDAHLKALKHCEGLTEYIRISVNLVWSLLGLAQATGKSSYVDSAVVHLTRLMQQPAVERSGYWPAVRYALAVAVLKQEGRDEAALRRACALLDEAAGSDAPTDIRLNAAKTLARIDMSRGDWIAAAGRLEEALRIRHEGVFAHGKRHHKEALLSNDSGVGAELAYCLAKAGDVVEAALALDRSQAVLLAEALSDPAATFPPGTAPPELIDYRERSEEWDRAVAAGLALGALSEQWNRLEAARRALAGAVDWRALHDRAGRAALDAALACGPVVMLGDTQSGGFALVLMAGDAAVVWLPGLTTAAVRDRAVALAQAGEGDGEDTRRPLARRVDEVLTWLRDEVLAPVVPHLPGQPPLIVASGILNRLPIRAAMIAAGVTAPRQVPNLRPLVRAHRTMPAVSLLVVAPDTGDPADDLPFAVIERAVLGALLPECETLTGCDASAERIVAHLSGATIAHVSCHGRSDHADPLSRSGLWVSPGRLLPLKDVLGMDLTGLRLAVLSACETAVPGAALPDEIVSFPTGLLQAGARGVIATQWSVDDAAAFFLLARFFTRWPGSGRHPSQELADAQEWWRRATLCDLRALLDPHWGAVGDFAQLAALKNERAAQKIPFAEAVDWGAFAYYGD